MTRSSKLPFGYLYKPSDYQNKKFLCAPTMHNALPSQKSVIGPRWERFIPQIRGMLLSNLRPRTSFKKAERPPLRKMNAGRKGCCGLRLHSTCRDQKLPQKYRQQHVEKSQSPWKLYVFLKNLWHSYTVSTVVECCWIKSRNFKVSTVNNG